jgi:chorismate mutase
MRLFFLDATALPACLPSRLPRSLFGLKRRLLIAALACATLGALPGAAFAQAGGADAGDDTALMNLIAQASQRIMLADIVARYKWEHHQSVTDPAREQALLNTVARQAPAIGVDPQLAQTFFSDQIEANKLVQQALLDDWRRAPPASTAVSPDLATSTRPQFDHLTDTLLGGLARVDALRHTDACPVRLAHSLADWKALRSLDSLHAQALTRAFAHLCSKGGVGAVS